MQRIQFITHKGKEILQLNFTDCRIDDALLVIEAAKKVIRTAPKGSLLTLTDVTNMRFDENVTAQMKAFTAHNKPFVRAAAVVGITGVKRIIFEAVILFSQRALQACDTLEEAKEWLVETDHKMQA